MSDTPPGEPTGPAPADDPAPAPDTQPDVQSDPAPVEQPDPVREVRSDDDRDLGWGDDLARSERGDRDARWYEEQRPPHWE